MNIGVQSSCLLGMMIESMAGKSAAAHGICHDATPFTFSENDSAVNYFGRSLLAGTVLERREEKFKTN